jgi:hypothetical protein
MDGRRLSLAFALWIAGCGSPAGAPGDDLSTPPADLTITPRDLGMPPSDFTAADLTSVDLSTARDLSTSVDLSMADLAVPDDLSMPADLSMPPDLTSLPDLTSTLDFASPPDLTSLPDFTSTADLTAPMQVDSGMCNTLVNSGAFIPETNVPADLPAPTGGTILLGLYELTAWENFTGAGGASGPTGNQRKTAFWFEPTVYYKVTADFGSVDGNYSRTWSTASTTLTSNQWCPTVDLLTSFYSVAGNTLTLQAGATRYTYAHR